MHQTSHGLLRETLRGALLDAVEYRRGGGIGSVSRRANAALYALLSAHPVDRRGRCRSCRRSSFSFGRRRRVCRMLVAARFYLHQPDDVLVAHLASEQDDPTLALNGAVDPARVGGTVRRGVVKPYEPEHSPRTFPLRFPDTQQWKLLAADAMTMPVDPAPDAGDRR